MSRGKHNNSKARGLTKDSNPGRGRGRGGRGSPNRGGVNDRCNDLDCITPEWHDDLNPQNRRPGTPRLVGGRGFLLQPSSTVATPRGRGRGGWRGDGFGHGHDSGSKRGGAFNRTDFVLQQWTDDIEPQSRRSATTSAGTEKPSLQPNSIVAPSRGRGRGGFRGRGDRQNWRRGTELRADAPLSQLLYQSRPLLKPVIFVRAVHTKTLFEQVDDVLQGGAKSVEQEEANTLPTADKVTRIFSGGPLPRTGSPSDHESLPGEKLEEIDFQDMSRIKEEIDAIALSGSSHAAPEATIVEESFTGFFSHPNVAHASSPPEPAGATNSDPCTVDQLANPNLIPIPALTEDPPGPSDPKAPLADVSPGHIPKEGSTSVFIDIGSAPSQQPSNDISINANEGISLLGHSDTDAEPEEIILYMESHRRLSKLTSEEQTNEVPSLPSTLVCPMSPLRSTSPAEKGCTPSPSPSLLSTPTPPEFDSVSFSFTDALPSRAHPRHRPVFNVGRKANAKLKAQLKEVRSARKRLERHAMTSKLFGTMGSVGQPDGGGGKDPRWDERRRGDSDIDWGDESGDGGEALGVGNVFGVSSGGGMDLDPELEIDLDAMQAFVKGMSPSGSRFVTMDDIEDEEEMRREEVGSSEDEDLNEVVNEEESAMMAEPRDVGLVLDSGGESDGDDDEEESSEDDNESPRSGFQARLKRLREAARKRRTSEGVPDLSLLNLSDDGEDDDFPKFKPTSKAEDVIASITQMLDDEEDIIYGHDRKARNQLFRAIQPGRKEKYISQEAQWEKDRAKKAENKRARAQARLELAADPWVQKKGGKKRRKAMLAAIAKLDRSNPSPSPSPSPNQILDMASVVAQIRVFVADVNGELLPPSLPLPPMDHQDRKRVHQLANVFKLKSFSKGKGNARYTTLSKTPRTGRQADPNRVARILKWGSNQKSLNHNENGSGNNAKGKAKGTSRRVFPKQRDGEEVGKAAPKIGESNIGYRLLQTMGWSEGDKIGVSGGLEVPLTAVIKNTKLGLGATRPGNDFGG